jgi:hypothetical protein
MKTSLGIAIAVAVLALAAPASASPVTQLWDVTGTFDDGGTLSGYFTWTIDGYLSSANGSLDLTTSTGTTLAGTTYSLPPSFPDGGAPTNGFVITNGYYQVLSLQFEYPLTPGSTSPDPIVVGANSYECYSYGCPPGGTDGVDTRYFTGGSAVAATPVPAALPLFASGIGGLGFIAWRRKRKARAVA